jgi:hypothetical protein
MGKLNDWRSRRRVRSKTSPKSLTIEVARQAVLRMLLLGLTTREIGLKLNKSPQQIRRMTSLPAFVAEYQQLQRDLLAGLDQRISRLLVKAVLSLHRELRHPDWHCRAHAREQILRLHGKWIEKLDLSGNLGLDHSGVVNHQHTHSIGVIPPEQVTDAVRDHLRAVLALTRKQAESRMLARLETPGNGHEPENGQ